MFWFNGHLYPTDTAIIRADNRGMLLGDGLFETLSADAPHIHHFDHHWARLMASLQAAYLIASPDDIAYSKATIEQAIFTCLSENQLTRAAIRITVTSGNGGRGLNRSDEPTLDWLIQAQAYHDQTAPLSLGISKHYRHSTSFSARHKSLSYMDPIIARRSVEADEALLVNEFDRICCAAAGNIFILADKKLITPPLEEGALNGIVRQLLIAAQNIAGYPVIECAIERDALPTADQIIITNSLMGARCAHQLTSETGMVTAFDSEQAETLLNAIRSYAHPNVP